MILAAAYSPLANGGVYHELYFIEKITDLDGRIIYQHQDSGTRVLSAQSAYLMTDMLRTVTTLGHRCQAVRGGGCRWRENRHRGT